MRTGTGDSGEDGCGGVSQHGASVTPRRTASQRLVHSPLVTRTTNNVHHSHQRRDVCVSEG